MRQSRLPAASSAAGLPVRPGKVVATRRHGIAARRRRVHGLRAIHHGQGRRALAILRSRRASFTGVARLQ